MDATAAGESDGLSRKMEKSHSPQVSNIVIQPKSLLTTPPGHLRINKDIETGMARLPAQSKQTLRVHQRMFRISGFGGR